MISAIVIIEIIKDDDQIEKYLVDELKLSIMLEMRNEE